jgi:acetyl-CoA carboxylase carboxyl transferase subunit beta
LGLPDKTPAKNNDFDKRSIGQGVFTKCEGCSAVWTRERLMDCWEVCPSCGHHHRLSHSQWRHLLLDGGHLDRWATSFKTGDPLGFNDGSPYPVRIARATKNSGADEAIEVGRAKLHGVDIAYGGFVFGFMGGSMGSVVGERIAVLFETAKDQRLPVLLLHASGGARMQEGILSLMQMAKGVSALASYREARLPFISLSVHPTTGGVAASTALLGDVNLAEPNALIGFAGPRVIENTLKTRLPPGFQRSEFLLSHGMIDGVVPRTQLKQTVHQLLIHFGGRAS